MLLNAGECGYSLTNSDALTDKSYDYVNFAFRIFKNLSISVCLGMCLVKTSNSLTSFKTGRSFLKRDSSGGLSFKSFFWIR